MLITCVHFIAPLYKKSIPMCLIITNSMFTVTAVLLQGFLKKFRCLANLVFPRASIHI